MKVNLKRLRPEAKVPTYGSDYAAGFDLYSCVNWSLNPGQRFIVPTGWAMEFPGESWISDGPGMRTQEYFYHLSIRPRSGIAAKKGITVLNTPGTVDSDYRGEVGVILINLSDKPFSIKVGDKIAQGIITMHERVDEFEEVDELEETERGDGGFGSTDDKEKKHSEHIWESWL